MGGVPREVTPTITPGIDITQFLLLNRSAVVDSGPATAIGGVFPAGTEVPSGELWYVHWMMVDSATLAAGETIAIEPSMSYSGARFCVGDPSSAVAGARASAFARDFWAPAGSGFGARINEITTAGTITVAVRVMVTRLRI